MNELSDQIDHDILMHRNAHFGGNFGIMLTYYREGGKGALLDLHRVELLAASEAELGQDLAQFLLTPGDWELLDTVAERYRQLRELCEIEAPRRLSPHRIAELILSEEEEEEAAMEAFEPEDVPALIDLLRSADFTSPLYPGFGFAPALAAEVLGNLRAESAAIPLFEALDDPHGESAFDALLQIQPREFLLERLRARPVTRDTERAATLLSEMAPDEATIAACQQLLDEGVGEPLATYLTLCCEL